MRETRPSGSEGGGTQPNESSLPLFELSSLPETSPPLPNRSITKPRISLKYRLSDHGGAEHRRQGGEGGGDGAAEGDFG